MAKPKKAPVKSEKPDKPVKKVKFNQKEENLNSNILADGLKFNNNEIDNPQKLDQEIEETEIEETEQEEEQEENILDEDNEVDDEIEYDDTEQIEDNEIDDLYDDVDGVKTKKKINKKKKKEDTEVQEENDDCEYDYNEIYDEKKEEPTTIVENSERITLPKLTKYEKVRLIGTRAKQISLGAKVMIKNTTGLSPIEIAKLELEHKMIPMKIKRILPNNKIEIWKLSELELDN